jgi:septum formation protein
MPSQTFILASKSAIRATLLRNAGFMVQADPARVDERAIEDPWVREGRSPDFVAEHLAIAKAQDVSLRHPGQLVIGADQTLALGQDRFSKVPDREAARVQISRLSGHRHFLHSGFAVARDGAVLASGVSTATLTMRALTTFEINDYLDAAGDSILGSVGCYQLEGLGVRLFEKIEGDYFTILGLPMIELLGALRAARLLEDA